MSDSLTKMLATGPISLVPHIKLICQPGAATLVICDHCGKSGRFGINATMAQIEEWMRGHAACDERK